METFLVGYGTLLYKGSLGQSIGRESAEAKKVISVIVRDYRRLFNLRPIHYDTSHVLSDEPIENGAMNVEPAPGIQFNGLGFSATRHELEILDKREWYYERQVVPLYSFETNELVGEGHVYVAPLDSPYIERDIGKLMPFWRDIDWARRGAYQIGQDFGQMYDKTTYLADGKTVMIDIYRDLLAKTGKQGRESFSKNES